MSDPRVDKWQILRQLRIQRPKNTKDWKFYLRLRCCTINIGYHRPAPATLWSSSLRVLRRRRKRRKRSHGGFRFAAVYFRRQDVRAVSSGCGPSIPRNRINILSLLSAELHDEWRAKSSNAEEAEARERGGRQRRSSFSSFFSPARLCRSSVSPRETLRPRIEETFK